MNEFKFFNTPIFYGNSNPDGTGHTDLEILELNKQIATVQSINSGLQQSCRCSESCGCKEQDEYFIKLKTQLGKSIIKALDI